MPSLRLLFLVALMPTGVSAPAMARATGSTTASLKSACTADYLRFCDGLDPGGREVVACFRQNIASVTPGC